MIRMYLPIQALALSGFFHLIIVRLLSKDFIKLIFAGFVIAVPIVWFAINRWLSDFAYRINIGFWPCLLACSSYEEPRKQFEE